MARVEWTPELVEMLIESVRSNEVVWDSGSASYKSKNAQESAWMQIASDCGLHGRASCAKAKWRDLRDTYRKKLKLLTPKSGDGGGAKKKWQWIDQMSFLKKFSRVETPTVSNFSTIDHEEGSLLGFIIMSNIDDNEDSNNSPKMVENENSLKLDHDLHPNSPACSSSTGSVGHTSTPAAPNFSGKRKRRNEAANNDIDLAILAELKKEKEDDEDTHFMKSLIPQLKRLDQKTKAFVKCKIQQLLFEAEFGTKFTNE